MSYRTFLSAPILGVVALACSSGNPSAPALGSHQIDRMGRAAVNTALTDPFNTVAGMTRDQVEDAYNAASDPTTWSTSFIGYIKTNLAILDGLDGNCGNQLLAASGAASPSTYNALAGVLVDDQLYLNTASGTCQTYLAVEGGVTTDCGGRTPLYNAIDVTYSVLALGAFSGVSNGITVKAGTTASLTAFPFLANPN